MGEILPSNLDLLQCWLLSDVGIGLESFDGGTLEYWDSHRLFLEYKRKQIINNYKSNLAGWETFRNLRHGMLLKNNSTSCLHQSVASFSGPFLQTIFF